MADSVLKLKIDDREYNNKLRDAAKGMKALEAELRDAGKSFSDVDAKVIEYTRELGKMSTQSTTARGKIGEMGQAFTELSLVYKRMTDQEKASPVGQAMAKSLEQLRGRTIEAKKDLEDVEKELKGVEDSAGEMGEGMKTALAVMGGNLMTKAVSLAADLGSEIVSLMNQSAELAKSAEGVQMAFDRLDRADILDNLRQATHNTVSDLELMKAAVKFNDFGLSLDELGTMLAFAQQKAKDTGQSVDYMVDSIVTGLGRKSVMILDNLGLSAAEISEKMKETGDMTKAVGEIIREQMAKSGDYVETASDRAAQANVRLENAMLELGNSMQEVFGYSGWDDMAADIKAGLVEVLNDLVTDIGEVKSAFEGLDGSGAAFTDLAATIVDNVNPALGILLRNLGLTKQAINDILGLTGKTPSEGGGKGTGTTSTQTPNKPVYTAPGGYVEVTDENGKVIGSKHFDSFDNNAVDNWKKTLNTTIKQKGGGGKKVTPWAPIAMTDFTGIDITGRSVNDVTKDIQREQAKFNAAGDEMGRAKAKSMIEALKAEKDKMMNEGDVTKGGFGDAYSHDFGKDIKGLESQMKNADNLAKQGQDVRESWQQAAGAIGSVGNALAGLEDPGAKIIGTVGQAIAQIALGFAQATAADSKLGVFGWIAAVAGGLGTMISTISAIKSATGYANGGVVNYNGGGGVIPGNSYKGDNLRMIGVNSGEIIMNTAQQNNVANALLSRQEGGVDVQPWVDGEKIFLGMNNTTRRQGRGEIVTTSMLKSKGIL